MYSIAQAIWKVNPVMFVVDNNNADDLIGTQRLSLLQVCFYVITPGPKHRFLLCVKNIAMNSLLYSLLLRKKVLIRQ